MPKRDIESFASKTTPARAMLRMIRSADANVMPKFTARAVLERLELMSDIQDGLGLAECFTDSQPGMLPLLGAFTVLRGVRHLVRATNEYTANPAQEAVATIMGTVVTRQYFREKHLCAGVADVAAASTRTDIVPLAIQVIAQPDVNIERLAEVPGVIESWKAIEQNKGFPPDFDFQ